MGRVEAIDELVALIWVLTCDLVRFGASNKCGDVITPTCLDERMQI